MHVSPVTPFDPGLVRPRIFLMGFRATRERTYRIMTQSPRLPTHARCFVTGGGRQIVQFSDDGGARAFPAQVFLPEAVSKTGRTPDEAPPAKVR